MANEGDIPELKIEITGDSSSAQRASTQATQGLKEVTNAANRAGTAAAGLGSHSSSAFGKLVQGGRAAHGAMMGLNTAMQGGVSTVIGLSRALNDMFILVRAGVAAAGPWALLALGIGVVLGAMRGLTTHTHAAAAGMKNLDSITKTIPASLREVDKEARKTLTEMQDGVTITVEAWKELNDAIQVAADRTRALRDENKKLSDTTLKTKEEEAVASNRNALANLNIAEQDDLSRAKTPAEQAGVKALYERKRAALVSESTIREGFKQLRGETQSEYDQAKRSDAIGVAESKIQASNEAIRALGLERALAGNKVTGAISRAASSKSAAISELRELGAFGAANNREQPVTAGAVAQQFLDQLKHPSSIFSFDPKTAGREVAGEDRHATQSAKEAFDQQRELLDAEKNERAVEKSTAAAIRQAEKEKGEALTVIERETITAKVEKQEQAQRDLERKQALKVLENDERLKLGGVDEAFGQRRISLQKQEEDTRDAIARSGVLSPEEGRLNKILDGIRKQQAESYPAQAQAVEDIISGFQVQHNALLKVGKVVKQQQRQAENASSFIGQ